mmetsp:Transcript_10431/g.26843  ORF Transcript_10431/g.26843 Transcript_10431/m.26843 type:complete len:241 (-) Transcript_10431:122-844(-)
MLSFNSFASASVSKSSVRGLGGKPPLSVNATPGANVATCFRSCSTVCVWLAFTILREPSAMRTCSVVVGADASTVSSSGSAAAAPELVLSSRMVRPSPLNGLSVTGGGVYASPLLSMMCTSPSAVPSSPMNSAGIWPRLTAERKAAFSGSSALRSGPSSTVKPSFQKVMVCSVGGLGAVGPSVEAPESDWPAPVKADGPASPPPAARHASTLCAPISSCARFMNSRGSSTSWPLPPPFCP